MLDIVGKRGWYFLLSALVIFPGLVSMIIAPGWITLDSGLKAGIDFSSGSVMNVTFRQAVEEDDIRQRMDELGHSEALIQRIGGTNFFIRTEVLHEAIGDELSEREVIERDLEKFLGMERDRVEFDTVSPIVAQETVETAFYALAAASVFILFFVWYAFRRVPKAHRYGVSAILALMHDLLIIMGIFSILGRVINLEVNSMFIVGMLIVAGYSVNDTIVVFDRLRENVLVYPNRALRENVNVSISETISRSLNTSLTLLLTLLALMLFGGATIREFLLVLLVGVVVGTYSSIGVASQLLVVWEKGGILRVFRRSA